MGIGSIVRHFEALGQVPVDIADIVVRVGQEIPGEVIKIKAVDRPFTELRGLIMRRKLKNDTTYMVSIYESTIVYSSQMSLPWQRLACAKELLHVADPDPVCTTQAQEVIRLASDMVTRAEVKGGDYVSLQTLADNIGRWQAVAALFPFSLYEQLLPQYQQGKVSLDEIAAWTQLPVAICAVVMTPLWGHMRETILAFA